MLCKHLIYKARMMIDLPTRWIGVDSTCGDVYCHWPVFNRGLLKWIKWTFKPLGVIEGFSLCF